MMSARKLLRQQAWQAQQLGFTSAIASTMSTAREEDLQQAPTKGLLPLGAVPPKRLKKPA